MGDQTRGSWTKMIFDIGYEIEIYLSDSYLVTLDPFPDKAVSSFGLAAYVSDVQSFVMDRSFLSYVLLIY